MKSQPLAILLVLALPAAPLAAREAGAGSLYGQRIVVERGAEKAKLPGKSRTEAVAADLATWLGKATGKTFSLGFADPDLPANGILLLTVSSRSVPAADRDRLEGKGKE